MNVTVTLKADQSGPTINKNIYGHFAEHLGRCIYEGLWVGIDSPIPNTNGIRNDVVAALKAIDIPVLRWPGGCFADEYHWKDGIGPRDKRPSMINTHWGGVVENNHFGTHEFFELCEQLGTEPYVCGNVGSGSVQEMMEWVEYMTSPAQSPMANLRRSNGREEPWKLSFFGVGNESWGCGGSMRPEYYADLYRRYNTFVKNYGPNRIYRIACGANGNDVRWTDVMMQNARNHMDGLSLHNYTLVNGKWPPSGSATKFGEDQWFSLLYHATRMDDLIKRHSEAMDKHDPEKRIGMIIDEWGTWLAVEPGTNPGFLFQQNSLCDALVAGIHFHIFHRHASRIHMANIAQTVNVLQAMVLTDGPRMLRTPTYWVFEMFKVHQGAKVIPVEVMSPEYKMGIQSMAFVSASASQRHDSKLVDVSLVNTSPTEDADVEIDMGSVGAKFFQSRLLTAPAITSHNTFDDPDQVMPTTLSNVQVNGSKVRLRLPSKSVAILSFDLN